MPPGCIKGFGKVKRDDVNMCMDAEHVCYVMKERYKSSSGRSSRTERKLVTEMNCDLNLN